jgi:translocation and assembly module TamA
MYGVYDTRDDPLDAKSGFYGRLDLKPFAGLQDSSNGARATFDGRTYVSLDTERLFTLAGRVQLGSIMGAPIDGVPNNDRFYSGGGGTVRGQEYQSLGIDFGGQRSGGCSFLGLSAEARVGITDAISGVGFVDFGMVGRDSIPDSSSDSHAGIGVGVRYDTGIGPIRADIAIPVADDIGFDDVHLYIGIGQAF